MSRVLEKRFSNLPPFDLFTLVLYGEARGEPIEGQLAVAWVIQNRINSGKWGSTYHDVLGAWAQFSCLWPTLSGGLNYQQMLDTTTVLKSKEYLDKTAQAQLIRQLRWVVAGVMREIAMDTTFGSLHYFATNIPDPYWAKAPAVRVATIGRHQFWQGVA